MKNVTPILLLALLAPGTLWAGGSEGGGASIVCKREPTSYNQNPIGSVSLIDLQEVIDAHARGKNRFIIPIREELDSEVQFAAAAKRLNAAAKLQLADGTDVTREKERLEKNKDVGEGMKIAFPTDTGRGRAIFLPADCELGAIGYRQSDGTLAISQPLYDKLDGTHRAAFWMHEAIYSMVLKLTGKPLPPETGTENIRSLVATLFASNSTSEDIAAAFRKLGLPAELEKNSAKRDAEYAVGDVFDFDLSLSYEGAHSTGVEFPIADDHECIARVIRDFQADRLDPGTMRLVRKIREKQNADAIRVRYHLESKYKGWPFRKASLEPKLVLFSKKLDRNSRMETPLDTKELTLGVQSDWHKIIETIYVVKSKKESLDELLQRGGCSFPKDKLQALLRKALGEESSGASAAAEEETGSAGTIDTTNAE